MNKIKNFFGILFDILAVFALLIAFGACFAFMSYDADCASAARQGDATEIITYCK